MKKLFLYSPIILILLFSLKVTAQDIISAKDLSVAMKSKNCVVISAQKPAQYAKVHITKSVNI